MTIRRSRLSRNELKKHLKKRSARLQKRQQRRMQLEKLEDRQLLAVGHPILVGVQPNDGERLDLTGESELNIAASQLTLRFDGNQIFDASQDELNQAIQVTRAGTDGLFDTADDLRVVPGYIGGNTAPNENEILLRFAENLQDDLYRVQVFGADDIPNNILALRNSFGEVFTPSGVDTDRQTIFFNLDLGAQIQAIIPQPTTRDANGKLVQEDDVILIYFNDDDLHDEAVNFTVGDPSPPAASVVDPAFYQLILTNETASNIDDQAFSPETLEYDPVTDTVKLTFTGPLYDLGGASGIAKTFRMRVGTDESAPAQPIELDLQGPSSQKAGFNIELVFNDDSMTAEQQAVVRRAADRIEQLIVGPAERLLIEVRAFRMDGVGNKSAIGFPTNLRNDTSKAGAGIPTDAELHLDWYDLVDRFVQDDPTAKGHLDRYNVVGLEETIQRELFHAMGFGTLWPEADLLAGPGGSDPYFVGPNALEEFNLHFDVSANRVPVENFGDVAESGFERVTGVVLEHWREEFFEPSNFGPNPPDPSTVINLTGELMTGFLNFDRPNLISRISVAAMADFGYDVDMFAADEFNGVALNVTGDSSTFTDGETISLESSQRVVRKFEFVDALGAGVVDPNAVQLNYDSGAPATAEAMAQMIVDAINSQNADGTGFDVVATIDPSDATRVVLFRDNDVLLSGGVTGVAATFERYETPIRYQAPPESFQTGDVRSSFDEAYPIASPFGNATDTSSLVIHSSIDPQLHGLQVAVIRVTGENGNALIDGTSFVVRDRDGVEINFEFVDLEIANGQIDSSAIPVEYRSGVQGTVTTAEELADIIATAINGAAFKVEATNNGSTIFLAKDNDFLDKTGSVRLGNGVMGVEFGLLQTQINAHGNIAEPGHRDISVEQHVRGNDQDYRNEITTLYYNFKDIYGIDADENTLSNVITPTQIQRAREIFEIYGRLLGVQFVETVDQGFTIVTGDPRAVRVDVPTGPGNVLGIAGGGVAIVDNAESWNDEFGGSWFQEAMEQIGHLLGLSNSFELPGTIQGTDGGPDLGLTVTTVPEPVFPGDGDIIHGLQLFRDQGKDIDLYRFDLQESGLFTAETFAERLGNSSTLDTNLHLYQVQLDEAGNPLIDPNTGNDVIELIARNDDYASEDSFIELELEPGRYYIGVTASGNDGYNPVIEDTGNGGTTEGDYDLRLNFRPAADRAINDFTATRFDGDADGVPGGVYNFWFRTAAPLTNAPDPGVAATIYVDKSNQPPVTDPAPNGELLNPFNSLPAAINFINVQRASHPTTEYIIRVVGNPGDDGDITTLTDNIAYEIGFAPPFGIPLVDGTKLDVPRGTTLVLDAGTIFKMRESSINVGSESPNIDRSAGALQVLGAPFVFDVNGDVVLDSSGERAPGSVYFTSWNDETIGADTNAVLPQTPRAGEWGGIIFRADQDKNEARRDFEAQGAFINYVNHADMRYGGGKVVVNSVQQTITPIHMVQSRPTVTFNSITFSAGGAMSADPDAFEISNFHDPSSQFVSPYTSDYQRIGPDINNNLIIDNSANALIIRIETLANNSVRPQTVVARWDDRDIVHLLTENLIVQGTPGGSLLEENAPPVELVKFNSAPFVQFPGTLAPGAEYRYRITFIDADGNEGPPSAATPALADNPNIATVGVFGVLQLQNLPIAIGDYIGRRIYRSDDGGTGSYKLIAVLNATDTRYIDDGTTLAIDDGILDLSISSVRRARLDAALIVDPGTVVKLEGSRVDVGIGANLIAEGFDGHEVIFTSHLDDRFGGSGTFDTNNDDALLLDEAIPEAGDWGGIIATPASKLSLDHVLVTKAGGITNSGGSFYAVNPIEVHQAEARITNSVIEDNEIGQGGQAGASDSTRFGLGFNRPAGIFVRGAQPIIVSNTIRLHQDLNRVDFDPTTTSPIPAISIDVGSLNSTLMRDFGRATGRSDHFDGYRDNRGPLIRENRIGENSINGMDVRGGILTTEGVWDDTDIVHVLRDQIYVPDFHTFGGLRIQSGQDESLVVKLFGSDAGFTATGQALDIDDRIGGTIQVLGQPGFPVILTSLRDDSFGAGFDPFGKPQTDTNGDLNASGPGAGDWKSILIDRYANDRNVSVILEGEPSNVTAPGPNATPSTAQFIGDLAPDEKSGDENRRLGFTIHGFLNDPNDLDVYSFTADPGTEVWFDIDRSYQALDTVIDVLDAANQLIASSDTSLAEKMGVLNLTENNPVNVDIVDANILQKSLDGANDHYTSNPRDAGFRLVVPGEPNPASPPTYFVRVRSSNLESNDSRDKLHNPANLLGGLTEGVYQLQIRLGEKDEVAGSTVRFAEIHYATVGIDVIGHPNSSPLVGEATEQYTFVNGLPLADTNGVMGNLSIANANFVGNVLESDQASISISGRLGLDAIPSVNFIGFPGVNDIDVYRFEVHYQDVQTIFDDNINNPGLEVNDALNNPLRHVSLSFDLDYSDGFSRANTIVSIYDTNGRLVFFGDNSNIAEDQPQPLHGADVDALDRGTNGPLDPYIGPITLPACVATPDASGCLAGTGTYYVVVSSIARVPKEIEQFSDPNAENWSVRLEPISSVVRIVDQHFITGPDTFLVQNDDLIGPEVKDLLPLQSTTWEAINRVTTTGGSNIADGPIITTFIDPLVAPVDWSLGDVKLYVSEPSDGGDTLRIINPFTGHQTNLVQVDMNLDVNDILLAPNGQLGAFTVRTNPQNDSTMGVYNLIDTGTGLTTGTTDDTILTFHAGDETGSGAEASSNVGVEFNATALAGDILYAVGDHQLQDQVPRGRNALYDFNYNDGAPTPRGFRRVDPPRHLDWGTDIRALGNVLTATRFAPINAENGDGFTIRVAGPIGTQLVTYTATDIATCDGFPRGFGAPLTAECNTEFSARNVVNGLMEAWDNSIPPGGIGGTVDTIFERVRSGSGGLDGAANAIIHPNPNFTDVANPYLLYVTSRDTNDILRYNAITGAYVDVFVSSASTVPPDEPIDIAIDSSGNVYVLNAGNRHIDKFNPFGNYLATVVDTSPLGRAQNLETGNNWSRDADLNITNDVLYPHATVAALGDGTFDYYRFDVTDTTSIETIIDIDDNTFDTTLFLYDGQGNLIASNDNGVSDNGDLATGASNLRLGLPVGTYVIGVGKFTSADTNGEVTGTPPALGDQYTLHVSVDKHLLKTGPMLDPVPELEPNHPWLPQAMTIGPDDNLYVGMRPPVDALGIPMAELFHEVVKFDLDGNFDRVHVPSGLGGMDGLFDINFHPTNGDLYVSSENSGQILSYNDDVSTFVVDLVTANSGGLTSPRGVVFGPDGNIYVASEGTDEILRYDRATGGFLDAFVTAASGGLDGPVGLVFASDGFLYVSSSGTDQILRFHGLTPPIPFLPGDFDQVFVDSGTSTLDRPVDLTFGPDGNLYVSSAVTGQVIRYEGPAAVLPAVPGDLIDVFVPATTGGLVTPRGLQFRNGMLHVADFFGDQVLRYEGPAAVLPAVPGDFIDVFVAPGSVDNPSDMVFGLDGNLYVAGTASDNVVRYDGLTGAFIDEYVPAGNGGLDGARGLTFDLSGNLLVASLNTDEVLQYRPGPEATLVVNRRSGTDPNGLLQPRGFAFNDSGNLVVADNTHHELLEYTETGAFVRSVIDQTTTDLGSVVDTRSVVFSEDFENGAPGASWLTSSTLPSGFIDTTDLIPAARGDFSFVMGTTVADGEEVINEAVWTVNLDDASAATLTFSHQDFNDEDNDFPLSPYMGNSVGDGVSISADGIDWFVVYTAPSDAAWQPVTIDLKAAADAAGIALGSQFMIKFQQTDNADDVTQGRGFDNIQIHAEVLDLTHRADLSDVVLFSDIDQDLVAEVRTLTFPAQSPLNDFRLEAARDPALGTVAPFEIGDNGVYYGGNEGKNPVLEVQYVGYGDGREYTLTASHTDRGNNLTTDFDGDIDAIPIPGDFRSNFNRGGFGPGGEVTGAAFLNGTLYFVSGPEFDLNDGGGFGGFFGGSTGGGLYRWNFGSRTSSFVANIFDTSEIDLEGIDPLVDDEPSASDLIPFGGLTEAPAVVENGLYANLLTGIGVDGRLVAFNPDPDAFNIIVPGQLEPIFFHNNSVVKSGGNGLINGIGYSELESNVIGAATADADTFLNSCVPSRGLVIDCDGMGVDTAPDGSRLGDGNEGGFGVGGFNFAGGAHGSSVTEPFSLADYSAEDQPFLYFSYFINIDTISDAFRVFASADGENWGMLATTDPTEIGFGDIDGTWHEVQQLFNSPATHWRQARIPLHNYAGKSDIRLRIDFSTHNEMNVGDPLTTGDELRAIPGAKLRDGQSFELNAWIQEDNFQDLPTDVPEHMANRFEVDLGHTLVLPSGGRIQDGDTITVDNNLATGPDTIVLEFDDDDRDGIRGNNYGDGVADGRILVPYDATLTPHEVALVTQIAIETALDRFIPREFTFLAGDDRGRIANTNDTLATAVETGMMFGSAIFTGDGFIGDNTRLTPDVRFPLKASADDILKDVDFYKFYAAERSQITINLSSTENVNLILLDADGSPVPLSIPDGTFPAFGNEATDPFMSAVLPHHNEPPEPRDGAFGFFQSDPGFVTSEGFYYVGISGEGNAAFDPFQMGTGVAGTSATDYTVTISVSNPDAPPINETDTNPGEITTVVENFETVNLDGSWTTSSTDPLFGRIRVTDSQGAADGNFALFMDYVGLLPTDNNNEAILSVDVTDLKEPLLRFSHMTFEDPAELELLPATYTGSVDGDGVSISMDGVNWIRVYDGASSDATWQQETIDLAAVALANGISLDGTLEIKFQQFDNFRVPFDGRGYDSISISEAGVPTALVHGDGRIAIDHEYTFINTFLNENRLNVPYAEVISSSFLTGRQIEGAPGVFAGKPADTTVFPPVPAIPPNRPLVVHAGLSVDQVAEVISHRLADIYNGGDDRLVKRDDHIVKLIGHQVTENDLGPQGNHPESLGLTRFGVTGRQFDFQLLPGDDLLDRTGLLYAETGTWENSGPFVGGQNNTGSAVINDIIIGFAERGEMVVNAANGTLNSVGWITNPQLRTDQVFDGAYQLEIRRAADYGLSVFPVVNDEFPYPFTQQFVAYRAFDTNERLDHVVTLVIPPASDVNDGQMFTLSDGVDQLTFEYTDIDLNNGVEAGNVAIPYLDFESDNLLAERIRDAINSPQVQDVLAITASLSDGDVVTTDSGSNLIDLFGNVIGRLPDNDIVESYNPFDFGDIEVTLHGVDQMTVTKDGKTSEYRVEYGFTGDANLDRAQGQIVLDSNIIAHASDFGIASNPAPRIGGNPATAVRNFSELNNDRLVPGLTIVNNLLYDNANGGISLTGETFAAALGPVPFVRVINNTLVGQGQVAANTGILVGENMSPTLLNNIVSNYQTGISIDPASASTVITGMLYKDNGTPVAGAGLGDFVINLDSPTVTNRDLFVDAVNENFYLQKGSKAIDSSVATVPDRQDLIRVTSPLGIPQSPILAPGRDLAGQLRVDDPTISTPAGQGQNTFKDRGALDRSDLEGPTAQLITPRDNDSDGLDTDSTLTVTVRPTGVFSAFEISLSDGRGLGNFVEGTGVNDATVNSDGVTVTRNGVFLNEGVDYSFSYNQTSNIVRLTALGGIYEPDSVYVITINNRDRHVVTAPSGDGASDADQFTIKDDSGSTVFFEFDSGYTIQMPNTLTVQVPIAGGGPGGISDGNTFSVNNGGTAVTFEFDSNASLIEPTNTRILLTSSDTAETIAANMVAAIRDAGLGLSPKVIGNGAIHVGGTPSHSLDISQSPRLQRDGSPDAIVDGQTFTVDSPGAPLLTFEFDLDQPESIESGNLRVPFKLSDTQDDIANILVNILSDANVGLDPTNFGGGKVHVGGEDHLIDTSNSNLVANGLPGVTSNLRIVVPLAGSGSPGGVADGQTFFVENASDTWLFEFDDDGVTTAGNAIISINQGGVANTQDEIVLLVIDALTNSGMGVSPTDLGNGLIEVGGTVKHKVDTAATTMTVIGVPGGAVPVRFKPDTSFSGSEMALAIIRAIDNSQLTDVTASIRGGGTIFINGVSNVGNNIQGDGITVAYLAGIKDRAENDLQPNQNSEETRFTILLGDNRIDFGDVADVSIAPLGQFKHGTTRVDDGARHVIYENNPLFLGVRVDSDLDGNPSADGLGDDREGNGLAVDVSSSPSLGSTGVITPLQISVPETFFIQAPDQGGVAVGDGETFTIGDGATAVTFEFDSDSNLVDTNNTGIAFSSGSTDNDIAEAIINAINNAALGLTPVNLGGGRVHLGSAANHTLSVFGPGVTGGGVAGSLVDGDTFTITNSAGTHTFEFDNDQQFGLTNTIIDIAPGLTHLQLAQAINDAILSVDLGITPLVLSGGIIELEGDDEDGVVFGGAFNPFIDTPITVTASGAGLLDAWIDFNRDGDFFDPGEKIFNSEALVRGVNELAVRTPTSFVPGDSFARFRFSTLGGLTSTGLAASGEVEGYVVTLRDGTPPVAIDDPDPNDAVFFETTEDDILTVSISVLSNDFDVDLPAPILTVFNAGTLTSRLGAVVALNANGTFTYDPTTVLGAELQALALGDSVVDTFTYRAFDGFLFSELATVSILVTGENDVPVARRLDIAADEDGIPVNGSFRGDDPDSDDDQLSLTYTVTSTVSEGVLTNNNVSTFTFDPGSDFQNLSVGEIRQVFFEYTATDRFNETSAAATGTVIVTGVNDAPTVSDMLVGAVEDGVAVTASFDGDDIDSDDNQASLRYEVFGFPTEGTFVNNVDGTFTFDPGNDFQDLGVGETRDITILYHAIDSNLVASNLASLTIRVTGTNDAPNAVDDPTFQNGYGTTEDNPISISNPAAGLLVNDSDPDLFDTLVVDGAPLVITSMFGASATVQPNGTFVYDPTSSPVIQALNVGDSLDDNFIYTVTDGNGGTDSATAVIAVAGRNDAPVAADVLVAAEEDGPPVTANFNGDDADAEDGPTQLTYAFVPFSGPSEGTIINNGNGTFIFDPGNSFQDLAPGITREVSVHYQAIDSRGTVSQNGTITIVVTGVNDAPTAVDDNGGFNARNGSTIIDLLGNDFDVDGSTLDDGSIVIVTPPTNGAVTVNGDGTVTYASTGSFGGSDSFSYQMMDDEGLASLLSNVADVTIVTTDLPTADNATVTTAEGTPIEIDILAITNDVDGSIDPASIEIISGPSNGAALIDHSTGSITYQPSPGYLGPDQFEYRVRDNVGAPSNIATITIDVVENLVPYRNPRNRFDVNDDGVVTPLDLLLVITFLNKNGSREPFGPRPPYLDVTVEDNFINLLDALAVITELRQLSLGEGEARLPAAMQPIDFSSLGNVSSTESVQQPLVQDSSQSTDEMLRRSVAISLSRITDTSLSVIDDILADLTDANQNRDSSEDERIIDDALLDLLNNGGYGV